MHNNTDKRKYQFIIQSLRVSAVQSRKEQCSSWETIAAAHAATVSDLKFTNS